MFAVIVLPMAIVLACLGLHLWALRCLGQWLREMPELKFRFVAVMLLAAILSHLVQIGLFAFGFKFLIAGGHGQIAGSFDAGLRDYFYYSAVTYTTLGYGDLTPEGDIRFMAAVEALTGLVLVAWTATFGFVVMQRHAQKRDKT